MARKAVEKELSREIILNAARELFLEKGYQSVSMRSIAKKMGYSHGSLYYHFQDKAELFYRLVADDFSLLFSQQMRIINESKLNALDKLKKMMDAFIQFGLENQFQYEIMFLIQDEDLRRYSRTEQAKCFDLFSTAVHTAAVESLDERSGSIQASSLAWSLFMSVHGFITYCSRFNQSYQEVESMAQNHVDFLCMKLLDHIHVING
ncbi:TetR/AcrR family transcriptional regulator [Marinicrinis lubricantis]|uniref:TetR/AcrR family transcriptional regulator n=1 Tax=Marinicrinis lubricantis TaxID=2086470 RepID=A0ABW1IKS8_9BACL